MEKEEGEEEEKEEGEEEEFCVPSNCNLVCVCGTVHAYNVQRVEPRLVEPTIKAI